MDLYDVMRTTFAARDFTDDPVPDAVIHRILDNARFAPSGGNRQGWKVLIVRDPATRDALGPLIEPTFRRYLAQVKAGEAPWNTINPTRLREAEIAETVVPQGLIDKITRAPVLLVVFVDLSVVASMDSELDRVGVVSGASVYPFVWNILLGARNEGYGGTLTTVAAAEEDELKRLLGVPAAYAFAAMIPLGKPVKQLTRLRRKPVHEFAVRERFDGDALGDADGQRDGPYPEPSGASGEQGTRQRPTSLVETKALAPRRERCPPCREISRATGPGDRRPHSSRTARKE
jgi:nitroreductase